MEKEIEDNYNTFYNLYLIGIISADQHKLDKSIVLSEVKNIISQSKIYETIFEPIKENSKITNMKIHLKQRNLKSSGNKKELLDRIKTSITKYNEIF